MGLSKVFTLGEAQVLLPVLESLLKRARAAALRAGALQVEIQALAQRIFLAGGTHVNVAAAARRRAEREKAEQEAKDALAEIEAIGARVHDFEEGLLDLPFVLEGRTVMLCWQLGETAVGHWHEEGGTERRPVEGLFGKSERERLN